MTTGSPTSAGRRRPRCEPARRARAAPRRGGQVRRRGVPGLPGADPRLRGDHGLTADAHPARHRGALRTDRAPRGAVRGARRPLSELLVLGASHKTAPLAVRERLALLDGQIERFLTELIAADGITEAVVVSTCNRTEVYVFGEDPEPAAEAALAGAVPLSRARNCDTARHLYPVGSGLYSVVVREAARQRQGKR